ncbi:MAG: hypothetical protein JHC26_01680 [Thermofilum sp.]|jgi:hypothetical protein|uniref:hypothetical protein n=1 Tax=Thermofilum sp. TaxID=1961369 RepID=UPI002582CC03|nr:hypothetical protein [Thermofilum sp.]MCI4407772.1 hypothetical protein [Thermofilum sp.]
MKAIVNWLKKIAKRYQQEGLGAKTMISGAASGLMFAFASSPSTMVQIFGGHWPNYVPQTPFQLFSAIAGIGLGYEAFHLYRQLRYLRYLSKK